MYEAGEVSLNEREQFAVQTLQGTTPRQRNLANEVGEYLVSGRMLLNRLNLEASVVSTKRDAIWRLKAGAVTQEQIDEAEDLNRQWNALRAMADAIKTNGQGIRNL